MFKFRPNVILRFNLLVIFLFTLLGIIIIGKTAIIMFVERDDWNRIRERNFKKVEIEPRRGNILSDNGETIVSTLPLYRMRFDFNYINNHNEKDESETNAKRDSIWRKEMHSLCVELNEILPGTSVQELEKRFNEGMFPKNGRRRGGFEPYHGNISYAQYKQMMEMPILKLGRKYSGFYTVNNIERRNILGNAGNSTFGLVRRVEIKGKKVDEVKALEKKYNEYLKGTSGEGTRQKIRDEYIVHENSAPQNGYDLHTTMNVEMLDICHNALEKELREKNLAAGWAILMETKSGDIKAIVNLSRNKRRDGRIEYIDTGEKLTFNETPNHALCDLHEPGSIFKTVALTAILADGKLSTKDSVIAYKDRMHKFSGASRPIRDEMYRDNGTGKYSMSDAMMYSSNISLIQFIRMAYEKNPREYINTLHRFGLTENYKLIPEESTPFITHPDTSRWSKFTLSSLSYGYAVEMTAINMVAFYNTIANGGKQMRPRLVKAVLDNGRVVEEYPTEVINEQLFPKEVADTMTSMLVKVVNGKSIMVDKKDWRYGKRDGTGKSAYSEMMTIAGKTGTARKYDEKSKIMSFCGFFPAEEPEYTLIVQMMYNSDIDPRPEKVKNDPRQGYGGGSTSAVVFKEIAEKIMADKFTLPIEIRDEKKAPAMPDVKKGNIEEAKYILGSLSEHNIAPKNDKAKNWGKVTHNKEGEIKTEINSIDFSKVPDVRGMGAKDATYLLQKCKLNVVLNGYGTVKEQSIAAGKRAVEGKTIKLTLEP